MILGCANQAGEDNRNVARMATTASRSAAIRAGHHGQSAVRLQHGRRRHRGARHQDRRSSLLIAGGVESMSRAPFVMGKADAAWSREMKMEDTTLGWRFVNPLMKAQYGVDSMAETGENVAAEFGISRAGPGCIRLSQPATDRICRAQRDARPQKLLRCGSPRARGVHGRSTADEHPRPDTTWKRSPR